MVDLSIDYCLKVPVVVRPEYTISFSQMNAEFTQAHCDIHVPWSRDVKKKIMEDWETLRSLQAERPLYAYHVPPDYKHHKFLTQVAGMEPCARNGDHIIYKTKD